MQTETKNGYIIRRFESLGECVTNSEKPATNNESDWERTATDNGGVSNWLGIPNSRDAHITVKNLIKNGWPEGVEKLEAGLSGLSVPTKPVSTKRRRMRSDQGDSVDMGRVWSGQLDKAWERCERREMRNSRSVSIVCDVWATWTVPSEVLFWRGAAALKLADLLTQAGYSVEIIAVSASTDVLHAKGREPTHTVDIVPVKEYSAPMDMNSLAATVCLSGFLRLVCFQNMRTYEGRVACRYSGHMSTAREAGIVEPHQIDGVGRVMDAESARTWVEEKLAMIEGRDEQLAA
jgi:hypothetical protein